VKLVLDHSRLAITTVEVALDMKTCPERPMRGVIQDGTTHPCTEPGVVKMLKPCAPIHIRQGQRLVIGPVKVQKRATPIGSGGKGGFPHLLA
jgi:hypothetical protein